MRVVFRVDASLASGTGHVMRCLALADSLRSHGAWCRFVCRAHPGNLGEFIRSRGHAMLLLPGSVQGETHGVVATRPRYEAWLGCDWQQDAEQCLSVIGEQVPDWLVVDHYGIDARWHRALRARAAAIMVIDDLADRELDCDVLLDPTLDRQPSSYRELVPGSTRLLLGPEYALLRDEFVAMRESSLGRRRDPAVRQLVVSLGGGDSGEAVSRVLAALSRSAPGDQLQVVAVMGEQATGLQRVEDQLRALPLRARLVVRTAAMAELLASADLAIGAAGGSAWERCCLGVPSILLVLEENQSAAAAALARHGAAIIAGDRADFEHGLQQALRDFSDPGALAAASHAASRVTDGLGCRRVGAVLGREVRERALSRIRLMTPADAEMVRSWRNHPGIRRFMHSMHEISAEEHSGWFARSTGMAGRSLLVYHDDQGTPCGFAQLAALADGMAEWGFYAAPDAPKGTGTWLGLAALCYAFDRLHYTAVWGEVRAGNEASIALHEKLGFREVAQEEQESAPGRPVGSGRRYVLRPDRFRFLIEHGA